MIIYQAQTTAYKNTQILQNKCNNEIVLGSIFENLSFFYHMKTKYCMRAEGHVQKYYGKL